MRHLGSDFPALRSVRIQSEQVTTPTRFSMCVSVCVCVCVCVCVGGWADRSFTT